MTAWRVGREATSSGLRAPRVATAPDGSADAKKYLDELVKYIPTEIAGAYTVALSLWSDTAKESPAVWIALLFTGLTALLVVGGWRQSDGTWTKESVLKLLPELALSLVAFCAWSLAIPNTGWLGITIVANNHAALPIIGVAAGLALPAIVLIAKGSAATAGAAS